MVGLTKEIKSFCRKCSLVWLFDHVFLKIFGDKLGGPLLREGCGKSKWKFKMAFAIRRLTPPLMAKFPDIFSPHFFSFATESYIYETDFTLQKYHF